MLPAASSATSSGACICVSKPAIFVVGDALPVVPGNQPNSCIAEPVNGAPFAVAKTPLGDPRFVAMPKMLVCGVALPLSVAKNDSTRNDEVTKTCGLAAGVLPEFGVN